MRGRTKVCHLVVDHPGRVHVDLTDGGLTVWSLPDEAPFANVPTVPADPLQDAPPALRKDTCACGWSPEEHDPAEHSPAPHVQTRPPLRREVPGLGAGEISGALPAGSPELAEAIYMNWDALARHPRGHA